ncbi:GvpT/GvpP family gas vesicle accessory protein [Cytobacillus oceanisediminis]|uniref:GvpT/GvpP family gas vesicle accessory protein n=1 Tax=Cytobacillus oceanisediminis TaxID=665099 RepID=UPI003736F71E
METKIAENQNQETNNSENKTQDTSNTKNQSQDSTENQIQETNNHETETEETDSNGSPIRRTITGGLIGAAIGYLATPENGEKLKESLSADKLKSTGSNLGQTVKGKSKKATESIKNAAGKLFKNEDVPVEGYSNESEENTENETTLKSNNEKNTNKNNQEPSSPDKENVNKRLDRLEEMLSKLLEDKEGQKETSYKSNSNG